MKKYISGLIIFFLASFANGGESKFDKELELWKRYSPKQIFLDKEHKVAGPYSIRMENGGTLQRYFTLKPDTVYELSFYVKGKNIASSGNDGGRIMLFDGKKKWGRITSRLNSAVESGTFDWRKGSGEIKSSQWGEKIRISLAMRGKGTIWFDEVVFREIGKEEKKKTFRQIYSDDFQKLALVPGGVLGFFDPGQKVDFFIHSESRSKKLEYEYIVKDENGKKILSVPRRPLEKKFSIPGQPCGYYVVHADFYADGKKAYALQSAFTVARKIEPRDPFFQMGHGVHKDFYDGFKRIGVGAIALQYNFMMPNLTPEQLWKIAYNFSKRYLEGDDFQLSAKVSVGKSRDRLFRTKEELEEGRPYLSEKFLDQRKKYIDLLLRNTKGKIKIWTFQQEINSYATMKHKYVGNWSEAMANFVILSRMGSRQIRKFDPTVKIRLGGNNVQKRLRDIEPIVLGDLVNEFDQYIIDAYTGNWDLSQGKATVPEGGLMNFYAEASKLSKSLGKGHIIGNEESGLAIPYGSTFDRGLSILQAELTARQLIISKAGPISHFELHMPGNIISPGTKEFPMTAPAMFTVWKPVWFGNRTFQVPLPGSAAYATAASQLKFAKKVAYFSVDQKYCAVFTKPDCSSLVVLWSLKNNQPFIFDFPVPVLSVNAFGREYKMSAGKKNLKLGTSPAYFTLKAPADQLAAAVKEAFLKQSPEFKISGYYTSQDKAKIFICNLSNKIIRGSVQGRNISVLPEKSVSVEIRKPGKDLFFQQENGKKFKIALAPGNFQKVVSLKEKPVFDGSGKWLKGLKKGSLVYPGNIAPSGALQKELCYFKTSFNPKGHNVSADYWIAGDKEHFYLAILVDDPIHLQRHSYDVWMDDSVQFIFSFGDPVPSELIHPAPVPEPQLNFGAGLSPKGPVMIQFRGKESGKKDFPLQITRKNNKTFYEIGIPYKALGGKPNRFGFVIFDNNYSTKRFAPYWLEYCQGVAGGADASKLKQLIYQ